MVEVRFAIDRLFSDISGLEKIDVDDSVKDVGGLEGLRKWLDEKKELLTPEKKAALRSKGLQPPRGILHVGVTGCGKSLTAKSISANGVNVVTVVPAASAEAAATNRQTNAITPEILLRIA